MTAHDRTQPIIRALTHHQTTGRVLRWSRRTYRDGSRWVIDLPGGHDLVVSTATAEAVCVVLASAVHLAARTFVDDLDTADDTADDTAGRES